MRVDNFGHKSLIRFQNEIRFQNHRSDGIIITLVDTIGAAVSVFPGADFFMSHHAGSLVTFVITVGTTVMVIPSVDSFMSHHRLIIAVTKACFGSKMKFGS